jgi:hypothetical protein
VRTTRSMLIDPTTTTPERGPGAEARPGLAEDTGLSGSSKTGSCVGAPAESGAAGRRVGGAAVGWEVGAAGEISGGAEGFWGGLGS